jgi:uncharacterized membrane protein YphA (DoxX/SURF4 family)
VSELGQAAALVLAAVFAWAAVAKVAARPATAASFRGLGLPAPAALAVAVPVVEVVLALGLVAAPAPASFAALAVLLAFSVVIGRAVARGSTVGCACFGGGAEDRPVSVLELVRNGGLGALAIVASGAGAGSALWPSLPAAVLVTVLVALARVGLAAAELRQAGGHVLSTPLPGEARR